MLKTATSNKEEIQKALNAPPSRDSIKQILLTRKTIDRLVAIAKGEKEKKGKQEEAKK